MAERRVAVCDLCGDAEDPKFSSRAQGFRTYPFFVGEVFDGYDRYEESVEKIVLCKKCQARVAKALHGKGKIAFDMFKESLATHDDRRPGA